MIIFGLGNPGLKYRSTRHNAGFILIDRILKAHKKKLSRKQGYALAGVVMGPKHVKVTLVKPLLFMNRSGSVVAGMVAQKTRDFLVVVDDINLPLGRLRIRNRGSDGGHLGLRSIIQALDSDEFLRLRIGVGMPEPAQQNEHVISKDIAAHVLNPLKRHERGLFLKTVDRAIKGIEILLTSGFEKAQNFINSVDVADKFEARNPKSRFVSTAQGET